MDFTPSLDQRKFAEQGIALRDHATQLVPAPYTASMADELIACGIFNQYILKVDDETLHALAAQDNEAFENIIDLWDLGEWVRNGAVDWYATLATLELEERAEAVFNNDNPLAEVRNQY